jgi:hypothetical protein
MQRIDPDRCSTAHAPVKLGETVARRVTSVASAMSRTKASPARKRRQIGQKDRNRDQAFDRKVEIEHLSDLSNLSNLSNLSAPECPACIFPVFSGAAFCPCIRIAVSMSRGSTRAAHCIFIVFTMSARQRVTAGSGAAPQLYRRVHSRAMISRSPR